MKEKISFGIPSTLSLQKHILENREEVLVPFDQMGFMMTHEETKEFVSKVSAYYNSVGADEIQENNLAVYNQYLAPDRTPRPPVEKTRKSSRGYIYVLRSEMGHHKIGKAVDPWARNRTIGTEHAYKVSLIYVARCTDYSRVETLLHQALAEYRMNGEWFDLPPDKVEWLIYHDWVDDLSLRAIVTDCERMPQ